MGRLSYKRLDELVHASWRDLTQSEKVNAKREMGRRVKDQDVRIFAEDLLNADPGLSALEAWNKAGGLQEAEKRAPAPVIYGKDAEAANSSADAGSDANADDVWLDELPVDEYRGPNAGVMDMIAECRRHPDKWRRIGVFGSRKRAQTRAASIRRGKAWAGFVAKAIDRADRHETWVSYRGDDR
ncbi:hypothetical protein [Bifidobacterium thermacidophilum]|uniref:Uncharacterized protein n=1 Tax=Bifidobacterium thermacidophilum subsp. thermacidophilum TaxID=79262 RepID=A0A087E4G1_9BIFI|nr:hypothetical protein [Bifidobacterium thermacidophilum]KFJ02662.1 hypothetical protein THER5_1125 [Bifidobacterium thermacidophilum subsp. thermacidophilum]